MQANGVVGFGTYQYGEPFTPGGKNSFGKLSQAPQISDNVTKILEFPHSGRPEFIGITPATIRTSGNLSGGTNGALNFDVWGPSAINTGNYLANFLTARVTGFSQDNAEAVQDMKYSQYSFFFNDQWKASRRLYAYRWSESSSTLGNWVSRPTITTA